MGRITIVGLGPGKFGLITLETWNKITSAEKLILRTAIHPTVGEIDKQRISYTTCDEFYEHDASFEQVYNDIAAKIIAEAMQHDVVYAVPGSPLVAERTVVLIREKAKQANIELEVMAGMSFLEVLYQRLNIDPIDGLTILDACDLANLPDDDILTSLVITQVYDKRVASDTKLTLMDYYPEDFPITFVRNLSLPDEEIRQIPLYELDRQENIDHLTSIYLEKPPAREQRFDLTPLEDIIKTLRAPGGCPWDIVQTHKSLRRNLIEEVYEVIEAIDLENKDLLCEELGDLLMQIVFHARMAEEAGYFSMQDVIDGITEKLIRRHPHVFGDVSVKDAGEVLANWEKIKRAEKKDRKSVLDGVPKDLPALMASYKLQNKASKVGFDWPDIEPVWDKLTEEVQELEEATVEKSPEHIAEEVGDVLFTMVNLARFLKIDPELALNAANRKFRRRFSYIENQVKANHQKWEQLSLIELDDLWQQAKEQDKVKGLS